MNHDNTYRVFPLGDSAITIDFGNFIDESINKRIISLFHYLQNNPIEGIVESVPAYSSLTLYYDQLNFEKDSATHTAFDSVKKRVEEILQLSIAEKENTSSHISIPVYYDGDDLAFISQEKNISIEEIIQIHSSVTYRVYMLGFLPGFAYMGQVDERIAIPRKQQPRLKVAGGSVGIAGRQTGIYPLPSPGGWQIIGQTPIKLFDTTKENPTSLQAGDTVQFYSITKDGLKDY